MIKRFLNRPSAQLPSRQVLRQELIDAFSRPGCFLCNMAQQKSQRYVETLLDTAVIDVDQRDDWRQVKGFCGWHAQMSLTIPQSPSSLAILYEDLLRHEIERVAPLTSLDSTSRWRSSGRKLKHQVQRWLMHWQQPRVCPACRLWAEQAQLYLTVLLDEWGDATIPQAFARSSGLCLPHVARLIDQHASHPHLSAVLAVQQQRMQALHADLQEFIRKQDYRFSHEPFGPEADAWERVVDFLVGMINQPPSPPQPPH